MKSEEQIKRLQLSFTDNIDGKFETVGEFLWDVSNNVFKFIGDLDKSGEIFVEHCKRETEGYIKDNHTKNQRIKEAMNSVINGFVEAEDKGRRHDISEIQKGFETLLDELGLKN